MGIVQRLPTHQAILVMRWINIKLLKHNYFLRSHKMKKKIDPTFRTLKIRSWSIPHHFNRARPHIDTHKRTNIEKHNITWEGNNTNFWINSSVECDKQQRPEPSYIRYTECRCAARASKNKKKLRHLARINKLKISTNKNFTCLNT